MNREDNNIKLSILLPVRNEGINLKIMVKILMAILEVPYEVLVVYDFPEDDTVPVIKSLQMSYQNIYGIHNNLGRGIINAIRSGVNKSTGEYVLIFATDEVGPVMAIEDMISLMDHGCDFVSCTRYAHGGRRLGGSIIGGLLSRFANSFFRFITRSAFTDSTTGIKMFRRSVFDKLHLEAKPIGWAVAFEMAMKAELAGLKLGEVPIVSIDRLYGGESTFRLGPWFKEYLKWFIWGILKIRAIPKNKRSSITVRRPAAIIR